MNGVGINIHIYDITIPAETNTCTTMLGDVSKYHRLNDHRCSEVREEAHAFTHSL